MGPLEILLAEDNAVNRMIIRVGLEQRGHRVTMVDNGLQACEAAAGGRFDLILMDMQMPVMDGGEATRRIRALPKPFSAVPIVALTADAIAEHRQAYLEAGLDEFLTKPVDWHAVDWILASHCRGLESSAPTVADISQGDATSTVPRSELPLLDAVHLNTVRQVMGDEQFAVLVGEMEIFCGTELARLREAARSGDIRDCHAISHELKGMFGNIGAIRAMSQAARLQEAEDCVSVETTLDDFGTVVGETLRELGGGRQQNLRR